MSFYELQRQLVECHYLAALAQIVRKEKRCAFFYAGEKESEALGSVKLLESAGMRVVCLVTPGEAVRKPPAHLRVVRLSDVEREGLGADVVFLERGSWQQMFAQFFERQGAAALLLTDAAAALQRYRAIAAHLPALYEAERTLLDAASRSAFCAALLGYVSGRLAHYRFADETPYALPGFLPAAGAVVFDGGAYDGGTARLFAACGAKVHAFEMAAQNFVLLQEAAKSDGFRAIFCGLWSKPCEMRYMAAGAASHITSCSDESARFTTLDAYAREQGLSHVDCIKLNIEGAELAALEGAAGVIERDKPRLALAVSHRTEHLWQLAAYLKSLRPDYVLSFRHYRADVRERLEEREKELLRRLGLEPFVPGDWGMVLYAR